MQKKGEPYDTIRKNGGFENCEVIVMESFPTCENKKQADERVKMVESQYFHENRLKKSAGRLQKSAGFSDHMLNAAKPDKNADCVCAYCGKAYSRRSNMLAHQRNNCKSKTTAEILVKLNEKIDMQQLQLEEQKEKINKIENQTITITNSTNNIQNIQNNIIVELGCEKFDQFLTDKQKLTILEKKYASLEFFIRNFHCNAKYPQFQCVKVPSLTKSHCEVFSQKDNMYITKNINDAVEQLVGCRVEDIQSFLEETPGVPENTEKAVRDMVEKIETDAKYKKEKCTKIKMDIYNRCRKKS